MTSDQQLSATLDSKAFHPRLIAIAGLWLVISFGPLGCANEAGWNPFEQAGSDFQDTLDSFDNAINSLSQQSTNWQVTLQRLQNEITEDLQSTLRVEVTQLVETAVLSTGSEFRCNAEYIRLKTLDELRRIRNDYAESLNTQLNLSPPIELLPVREIEPYVCNATPNALDMTLEAERRATIDVYGFDFRSKPIIAFLVTTGPTRNITQHLSIISDTHMVLDLSKGGANPDNTARKVALHWSGHRQATIPIIVPDRVEPCVTAIVQVPPDVQDPFVPNSTGLVYRSAFGTHTADDEFSGHGPCTVLTAKLQVDEDLQRLFMIVTMRAFECNEQNAWIWDWTEAKESIEITLYNTTGPNQRILGCSLDENLEDGVDYEFVDPLFRDTGHGVIPHSFSSGVFTRLEYVGDTNGNDAGIRTAVTMHVRGLTVTVEDCTPTP